MIKGIGVDLCNIPRISVRMKSKKFLEKIFVETEIAFAFSKACPEQHLAGFYAAREALSKALTLGLWRMGLKNAWVVHNEEGDPRFCFNDKLAKILEDRGISKVWLSISHENNMAIAFVILEA
ncbi:MAG TPA: holo-ACP synthase [Acetomicrobium sp.]|uniref:holo-ACP synthase n=1 Tax=Acetomicrobium sp. TaxID=1872099 RepID=UPI002B257CA3|nr:holo-ACP synthase [Acetomicrobium sp.]HPT65068.1 holo-ACP synthase [Acetomicrobium sp.]HXK99485.1 holo-ACP synthase [Acetomicrobium sp.]